MDKSNYVVEVKIKLDGEDLVFSDSFTTSELESIPDIARTVLKRQVMKVRDGYRIVEGE